MSIQTYFTTLFALFETDFKLYKRTIKNKLIDLFIWIITMVSVTAYLMPYFGLQKSYAAFTIASLIASAGLFELYTGVTNLISDFEGNNITSYYLTLPIPSVFIFIRNILFYSFNTATLAILVLPVSKLIVWNDFDLSHFSLFKFLIIFMLTNLFYACFTLWIASRVENMEKIGSVWMRFVYPLWFLGGFQYSYQVLYNVNPTLAYISLINPMLYIMEGTRAAVLGQENSLNFWLCAGMLLGFIVICSVIGIIHLKKRLDFI